MSLFSHSAHSGHLACSKAPAGGEVCGVPRSVGPVNRMTCERKTCGACDVDVRPKGRKVLCIVHMVVITGSEIDLKAVQLYICMITKHQMTTCHVKAEVWSH